MSTLHVHSCSAIYEGISLHLAPLCRKNCQTCIFKQNKKAGKSRVMLKWCFVRILDPPRVNEPVLRRGVWSPKWRQFPMILRVVEKRVETSLRRGEICWNLRDWFFGPANCVCNRIHTTYVRYIYLHENHKNQPNVGKYMYKYTIHGWYGVWWTFCFRPSKICIHHTGFFCLTILRGITLLDDFGCRKTLKNA